MVIIGLGLDLVPRLPKVVLICQSCSRPRPQRSPVFSGGKSSQQQQTELRMLREEGPTVLSVGAAGFAQPEAGHLWRASYTGVWHPFHLKVCWADLPLAW